MMTTIIGAKGFIGSHLVRRLEAERQPTFTPGKNDPSIFEDYLGNVIYCAGLTSDYRQRPFDTVEAHVCFLNKLLQNAKYDSLVYLSSTRVYIRNAVAVEEAVLSVNPNDLEDIFNISKLMGESVCIHANNPNIKIARISNVYGDDFQSNNFLFSIIKDAIEKKHIALRNSLDSEKDYISIDDVVDLLLQISNRGLSGIYNVASGVNISNQTIVDLIREVTGCSVSVAQNPNRIQFPPIDITKIRRQFGFKPRNIEDDLRALVTLYQNKH